MNIKRVKDRGGFTLAEALVVSSVFVVVSAAIMSLLIYGSNLWQLIITQNELRSGASTAIYYMTKELQNATCTSTPPGSPPNLTIPSKPNNNSIKFFLPKENNPINNNGSTNWDTSPIQYQYISASKQLSRSSQSISKVICNNVASVEFEDSANNGLKIILKVEKNTLMGIRSTTLTSIIKPRN